MAVNNYTLKPSGFNYPNLIQWVTVVIPNGAAALSDTVDAVGLTLHTIIMPTAWQTADITFLAGDTVADLASLYYQVDNSTAIAEVTVKTPTASKTIHVHPEYFLGAQVLQLRSGTSALAVNQTADRTIKLGFRAL